MSETLESGKVPNAEELDEDGLTVAEREFAVGMLSVVERIVPPSERRDSAKEVAELEDLLSAFEAEQPLEELRSIQTLTQEEATQHPTWRAAQTAIAPIVRLLYVLNAETNIATETYEALYARYLPLSKALGIISTGDTLRHEKIYAKNS